MTAAADLAGAFALALSVALLCARRISTGAAICALQALLAASSVATSGAVVALLAFALNGIGLPLALRHVMATDTDSPRGSPGFWLAAFAIVVVSIAASRRLGSGSLPTLGATIVLLGLLLVAHDARSPSRILGLLSSQNGVLLLAGSMPDTPPATLLLSAVPLLPALFLAEAWWRR